MNNKFIGTKLFIPAMFLSIFLFYNFFQYPRKIDLFQETRYYDVVLAIQSSGYFEFTLTPVIGNSIEVVFNKEQFNK